MNKESAVAYINTVRTFDENLKLIGKELNAYQLEEILRWLHKKEALLNKVHTDICNRPFTEDEYTSLNEFEKVIVSYVKEKLGFECEINRDPRGYAIRIKLPNGKYNSWDGETWTLNW